VIVAAGRAFNMKGMKDMKKIVCSDAASARTRCV
jgi:hypothetical protein